MLFLPKNKIQMKVQTKMLIKRSMVSQKSIHMKMEMEMQIG